MKWILKLALAALLIRYTPKFCHKRTDGFTLIKIHSHLPFQSQWEVSSGDTDFLKEATSQKFYYLASGGQAYAFCSEDGQYVLKFFKHHLRRLPFLFAYLPMPHNYDLKRQRQYAKRERKLKRDFQSYKIAFEELREETGVLYVQLNKKKDPLACVCIVDKIGIEHPLDLREVEFILQRKAALAYPYLFNLIEKGQIEEAKESLNSLIALVLSRCEKGIYDEDAKISRNFGFIEKKAVLIDVGRLKKDERRKEKEMQAKDLKKIFTPLKELLSSKCPQLSFYLQEKINDQTSHP